MKMTVEQYLALNTTDASKEENITALLNSNDRALYDLELAGKGKLSPSFLKLAMPIIVKSRGFEGSFKNYENGRLNPLSNLKIFYDRISEYTLSPVTVETNDVILKEETVKKAKPN